MVGRDRIIGKKQSRKTASRLIGAGAGASLFLAAAAAMATGSAAPAKADFEDLLDPILQPLLTQVTDSISVFDPTLATDLTSWTDTFLGDLNSLDSALSAASTGATAAASSATSTGDSPVTGTYDIPITMQEDTEPTVQATIDGASNSLLVDTGSSGLVIPWQDLGSNDFTALENLFELGFPTGISESGYSGGVDYIYLTYNDVPVDYGNGVLDTTGPADVEILSWPSSFSSQVDSFQQFLQDDDVTGILGIGDGSSAAGPSTEGPLQSLGYDGVTVDIPQSLLIVDPNNPFDSIATVSGAPISQLSESVGGGAPQSVYDDLDSGGVYGTIPSSLTGSETSVPSGTLITVYDGNTPVYTYETGTDSLGDSTSPTIESGIGTSASDPIDSGVVPFEEEPIYLDYVNNTLTFDKPI
jgi:hypothetical protein